MTELRPYDRKRRCPKCHFARATTEYQKGYHGGIGCALPLGAQIEGYWGRYRTYDNRDLDPEVIAQQVKNDEAHRADLIPEHFERVCPNCRYRWAEAV
jgi:hypothetical protein